MSLRFGAFVATAATFGAASYAHADTALALRTTWSGTVDFFATGASLADDGSDGDSTAVDELAQPATVVVDAASLPAGATLVHGTLYWAGSVAESHCGGATIDRSVELTVPGASSPATVTADACYCSQAGSTVHDIQACRADVTLLMQASGGGLTGAYTVNGFAAKITNDPTDNASFSVVLVYSEASLPQREVALYDGIVTMESNTTTVTLGPLVVGAPASGDLTWYAVEGDVGGTGTEQVKVRGRPGGTSHILSDAINPTGNPMNHTINTVATPRTDTLGVDIDRFSIDAALAPGDTSIDTTYDAGADKWWLVYNLVGVDVFAARLGEMSTKSVVLRDDADDNGVASVGDTLEYTIALENTGNGVAVTVVQDPISPAAASWHLVDAGGGVDASTPTTLVVTDLTIPVGDSTAIVLDVVLGDVEDESSVENVAWFDATPTGDAGELASPDVVVRRDGDGDTIFDNDDNCPSVENPLQEDGDGDGEGDACDACPLDAGVDPDGDDVCQSRDNCPAVANPLQEDGDDDGQGDACDPCPNDADNDVDGDGVCGDDDDCASIADPAQADGDGDGAGDACDPCPNDADNDVDADGVCGDVDNCPIASNPDQADTDGDGAGDACMPCKDADDNGICDAKEYRTLTLKDGCNCGASGAASLWAVAALTAALWRRRRT